MAIEVKATKQNTDREVLTLVDLGDNLEDAVQKFGAEVVFTNFQAQAKIKAQAIIRDMMTEGKKDEEIQEFMNTWKPGVSRERNVDPLAAFMNKFKSMTAEEQDEKLKELMALAGGAVKTE